ncbi:methyltransferase type 11, partial [Penicillium sp. IBT 31633x]
CALDTHSSQSWPPQFHSPSMGPVMVLYLPKGFVTSTTHPHNSANHPSPIMHWEALAQAIRREGLAAPGRPREIRDAASAKLLGITSGNSIAYEDTSIVPSPVRAAGGVVFELDPEPGNRIYSYDKSLVKRTYSIEPIAHFKDDIDVKLDNYSLRDRYKLI